MILIALAIVVALALLEQLQNGQADNQVITGPGKVQVNAPASQAVLAISQAIATAEGFYISDSVPERYNNPGDLEIGDIGLGTYQGKTIFATVQDGWNALYNQVTLMLNGNSSIYSPSDTLLDVAYSYVGDSTATSWANNVATKLGVSASTTLAQIAGNYA